MVQSAQWSRDQHHGDVSPYLPPIPHISSSSPGATSSQLYRQNFYRSQEVRTLLGTLLPSLNKENCDDDVCTVGLLAQPLWTGSPL